MATATGAEAVMAGHIGEPVVPLFTRQDNGDIELVGDVWPEWTHIDPLLLTQADPRHIWLDAGHVIFAMSNGSARYVISGVVNKGGYPVLVVDRVWTGG